MRIWYILQRFTVVDDHDVGSSLIHTRSVEEISVHYQYIARLAVLDSISFYAINYDLFQT